MSKGFSWDFGEYKGRIVEHGTCSSQAKTLNGMKRAAMKQAKIELGRLHECTGEDIRIPAFVAHFPIGDGWNLSIMFVFNLLTMQYAVDCHAYATIYAHDAPCPHQFVEYAN